jgi:hypothetical protein
MFPDTTNAQQSAALRMAAERARTIGIPRSEFEESLWMPVPPRRESFNSAGAFVPVSYTSAHEELSYSSR